MRTHINRIVFFLLYCAAISLGLGETKQLRIVSSDEIEKIEGRIHVEGENLPFTGIITESEVADTFTMRSNIVGGYEHGIQRLWHINGKLSIEYTALEGKMQGLSRTWHYNGNLSSERYNKDGLLNGQLAYIGYHESDVPVGCLVWFHENGRPKKTGFYKDDKPDGLWVEWDEEGKEISRKYFSAEQNKEITEKEWLAAVERQSKTK